jgi:hypothetical protein
MGHSRMNMIQTLALAATLSLCGASAAAFQDVVAVDRQLVAAISLTPAQKSAIDKFVDDHQATLLSSEPAKVMIARKAILEPMLLPQVQIGTAYRIHLSSKMLASLRQMVDSKGDESAINALIIAGEIGTQQCVELLQLGVNSPSASVRRAGAYGMQRTFLALANHQPAMLVPVAEGMISSIETRLKVEDDPQVVLALVQAIIEASRLRGGSGQFNLGNAAIESLCKSVAARASLKGPTALDGIEIQAVVNAVMGARDLVSGRAGITVPDNVHRAAAELVYQLVAHALRVVTANGLEFSDSRRREVYAVACDLAVNLAGISGDKLQPGFKFPDLKLGDALRKGDKLNDGVFLKGCEDAIATLAKPPFGLGTGRPK